MRRHLTAIVLLISFTAMSTSGLLMLAVDQPSFTLRMHPVHKLFGLMLIAAALSHLQLNARPVWAHLQRRSGTLVAAALTALMVATYAIVVMSPVPKDLAAPLDQAAAQAERGASAAR